MPTSHKSNEITLANAYIPISGSKQNTGRIDEMDSRKIVQAIGGDYGRKSAGTDDQGSDARKRGI